MRPSNTGKSDPQQPAPAKRGFFAAAGERLKRAMSGRAPAHEARETPDGTDGADGEATTSVQAKARELLLQDRTQRRGQAPADGAAVEKGNTARKRRTSPPPLPSQRATADATSGSEPSSSARPKRPARDSKSEALRARLGAAKAALAQAQAKRAAEQASSAAAPAETPAPQPTAANADTGNAELVEASELEPRAADDAANAEFVDPAALGLTAADDAGNAEVIDPAALGLTAADADASSAEPVETSALKPTAADADARHAKPAEAALQPTAAAPDAASDADLADASAQPTDERAATATKAQLQQATAAQDKTAEAHSADGGEPIRTLTVARLLARQGYFDRSLSIYEELLRENSSDADLRAEVKRIRAKHAKRSPRERS